MSEIQSYIVTPNSLVVTASSKEEASEKASRMIDEDVSWVQPFDVEEENDV